MLDRRVLVMRAKKRLKAEEYLDDVFFKIIDRRSKKLANRWLEDVVQEKLGEDIYTFNTVDNTFTVGESSFDYNYFHIKTIAESILKDKA